MAKKNGTSWFTAVKRVLWSPSKDSDKKIHQKEAPDYNKKKEKKGWIFRKTKLETTNYVTEDVRTIPTAETEEEEKPVAADEATAEIITLRATPGFIRRHWAAIIIQTAFRGYLARKALRALKGIVKLQALVRGNNVRNQAKLTLRCIKALVRVQDQVLNHHQQRSRILSSSPSYYNLEARRNSMFAESNGFLDSRAYLQDIRSRRSLSRDMSRCSTNDFVVNQEETQSILHKKLEIAIKREKAQALALSNQIRRRNLSGREESEREILERSKWLNRWMATKQWDNNTITQSPIKTQRSYPVTPRSASPRIQCSSPSSTFQPNYMTATESAKAKARTQSTPRRRPTTAKKRLCYVEEESLSCVWGDHGSDYSCCYGADGFNGKISPCSTTDLRWLK